MEADGNPKKWSKGKESLMIQCTLAVRRMRDA
jgi:hypothetical protein